jgi:hypothetical protein
MRSILLILGTVLVLVAAFCVYAYFQPIRAARPARTLTMKPGEIERPKLDESLRMIGSGDRAWMIQYDKTGELASQFRGEHYEPQKDGTVNVVRPQADFFLRSNGVPQRLRIEGATGNVVMDLPPEDKPGRIRSQSAPSGTPSRGRLQDVKISLFEPVDSPEPMLVIRLNNAKFDNDEFRVSTEAFTDEHGQRVEADQVPVTVRGRDYDFDGRGLVIRWNERDRKLQLLEIAHGDSLTVKHPSALGGEGGLFASPATAPAATDPAATDPAATDPAAAATLLPARPLTEQFASADSRAILAAAKPTPISATTSISSTQRSAQRRAERLRARRLRSAAVPSVPTTRPKIVRDLSPTVYRATFEKDVRVLQAGQELASADEMNIDLLQLPGKTPSTRAATTRAATTRAAATTTTSQSNDLARNPATQSVSAGAEKPAGRRRGSASTHPATAAASGAKPGESTEDVARQAEESAPIIVKWSGRLRVVPLDETPAPWLVAGKALVQLVGAPVVLRREGAEARCGAAFYNTADGSAALQSNAAVPAVTLHDSRGSTVTTPEIEVVQTQLNERIATLIGASRADLALPSDGAAQALRAAWTDQAKLHLTPSGEITAADLSGDVTLNHPKMDLTSQTMSLAFEPAPHASTMSSAPTASARSSKSAATQPSFDLKRMIASGDVDCTLHDGEKTQTIQTDRLSVDTATDSKRQVYPKFILADGHVHTRGDGAELSAGHLAATLAPATRPTTQASPATTQASPATTQASPATTQAAPAALFGGGDLELVALTARDGVVLHSENNTTATADVLKVETVDGAQRYRLIGKPTASVSDGKSTLVGETIRFAPDQKIARIDGPGTMQAHQPEDVKKTIDISWSGGAVVNGATNLIDVDRNVVVQSIEDDGSINHASGDHLRATLIPRPPTTQSNNKSSQKPSPTSAPAANVSAPGTSAPITSAATTRPSKHHGASAGDDMNFMADKDIGAATLSGNVHVTSDLSAADGALVRGMDLLADTVTFDRATGRLEVPVPGKMLYQDHRAPEKPAANAEGPTLGSGRGATAFEWQKSMVYDQKAMRAVMVRDVQVVHQPEGNAGQPFNLTAQTLTAEFEPDQSQPAGAAAPATTSASAPATTTATGIDKTKPAKLKLRRVVAETDVKVSSPRLSFRSKQLSYDPQRQMLIATGDANAPVIIFDTSNGSQSRAGRIEWNTKTDEFKIVDLNGAIRR